MKLNTKTSLLLVLFLTVFSCQNETNLFDSVSEDLPLPPKLVVASNIKETSVDLAWSKVNTNNPIEYGVYLDSVKIATIKDTFFVVQGLLPITEYQVGISTIKSSISESKSTSNIVIRTLDKPDEISPSIPDELEYINETSNSIDLIWKEAEDNVGVVGYRVFQNDAILGITDKLTYAVNGLIPNTEYIFNVMAYDAAGNASEKSLDLVYQRLEPIDETPPTAPMDLYVKQKTENSVLLEWKSSSDNSDNVSYKVYQDEVFIGQTNDISYLIENLESNSTYSFSVSAIDNDNNESPLSNIVNVTTNSTEPESKKILLVTKTTGYDHDTRDEVDAMLSDIAVKLNVEITLDDTGDELNSIENLSQFDIIFFSNTSGDFLNEAQRAVVELYASQGGDFISNHAASDAYGHSTAETVNGNGKGIWDWYAENVTGCSVRNNPYHTASNYEATVVVQVDNIELTKGINFPWQDIEEWYYWDGGYLNTNFEELLRVSETGSESYDKPRMTSQYYLRADGGISFYTSMGHSRNKYQDPEFTLLIENAINFMLQN